MTREEVVQQIKKVIYDSVPELAGKDLEGDTVINTETAIDSMGFISISRSRSADGTNYPH